MIERPDSEILINYLSFTRAILFKVCLLKRDIPTSLDITKCTQLQFVDVWRCSLINVAAFLFGCCLTPHSGIFAQMETPLVRARASKLRWPKLGNYDL